ncbi:toxin-antitoxin system YwqK family antitoxin [Entomomonas asaccharolytica]|uniref:Toxin-antitoxin system YwqK family antitoxin n=1 Tax=Entomomonas asaccharolytica TaxID=2785331 RepID=A0A974RXS9_9GAMM|nr:toxin-antitoxin system YwqK family antitoxin [Entomomonas asaccharolytica]QQP86568.1 toxin-antitoxin system YwqK family antitoxin [Entomomonas asaccharolytica]
MNKIIYLIVAVLVIGGIVMFQTGGDNTATPTVIVNYKEGEIIAQNSEYYRKFMGKNTDNFYVVQDFYSGFDTKLTNPFTLTRAEHLTRLPTTAINDSGYYASLSIYRTFRLWTKEGDPIEELNFMDGKVDGPAIKWYPNGQQMYQRYYKGNVPDGLWSEWYANGQLKSEGLYADNKQIGPWRIWFEDGSLTSEVFYTDGIKDGSSVVYNQARVKLEEGNYRQGKKQGMWHFSDQLGENSWQGEYQDDMPIGKWQWFFEDRKITEGEYQNGLKEGIWTEYDGNDNKTKEITYRKGQKVSEKTFEKSEPEPETEETTDL